MATVTLEVCVDTLDDAVTASAAGADRIELCCALDNGGLTPSFGLVRNAVALSLPIFAMIRPRGGDFHYSAADVACMVSDIECLRDRGISGFVFGALDSANHLDDNVLEKLIAACHGLPTTLHRAFDLAADPLQALEKAIQLGFDRILTSGAAATASEGLPLLARLFRQAGERIIIVPGGGVSPATVGNLLDELPVMELHASCKSAVDATRPAINVGRGDARQRFHTDPDILAELLSIIKTRQEPVG